MNYGREGNRLLRNLSHNSDFLMTVYTLLFYIVAGVTVASTAIAVTRRHMVHAVVYAMLSFFGTAMLFYLLGAPLLAALEVIIYAGAIMVLFLFVVMMIQVESPGELMFPLTQWLPALLFGSLYAMVGFLMVLWTPGTDIPLRMLMATPRDLALFVFQKHWLAVEIASLLLLAAIIGALQLGMKKEETQAKDPS
jgi:NADH-quinone oxidoreductase subunit J